MKFMVSLVILLPSSIAFACQFHGPGGWRGHRDFSYFQPHEPAMNLPAKPVESAQPKSKPKSFFKAKPFKEAEKAQK